MKKMIAKTWNLFPWIWMMLGTLYDIWYQIVPGKWILDSDLASDMLLAAHLNKYHRLISRGWLYSTELKVFESQNFYQIGLLLSPNNWHVARVIAATLMYAVFVFLLYMFAKNIGLGEYAPWMAAILMWPFGRVYLIYAMYGTYYLVYMYFSLAVMIVLFRLFRIQQTASDAGRTKVILLYATGILCSLGSGLNGIKQMMIFFAPLFLTAMVMLFITACRQNAATISEIRNKCREVWWFAWNSFVFVSANAMGYLINMKVLARYYQFDQYTDTFLMDGRKYRIYDMWMDFLLLFGYDEDVELFSFAGIAGALGLVFAGIVVVCLVRLHVRFSKLDVISQTLVVLVDLTVLFESAVYCFMGNYKNYFWLPLFPFVIGLILLELKTEKIPMLFFKKTVLIGMALLMPILSRGSILQEMAHPQLTTGGYVDAVAYLMDSNLTEGYATFWNSAVLEEMSSGRIKTWMLYNVNDSFLKYGWQQERERMDTEPQGRCFLLVNEDVDGRVENSALVQYGTGELVYHQDSIYIYEFESPSKIQDALDTFIQSLQ